MTFLHDRTADALVLVDLQARLLPAIVRGKAVVRRARLLARAAKALGVPVVLTEQTPGKLGPTVPPLADATDRVAVKTRFDASREPALADALEERTRAVVAGAEAHVCVLQTCLGLLARGHAVTVVADAVGSRRAEDKAAALDRLAAAGVTVATSEMIVFEWLETADDPAFRELLPMIRDTD
jgi:nicotinamidase-related amidase